MLGVVFSAQAEGEFAVTTELRQTLDWVRELNWDNWLLDFEASPVRVSEGSDMGLPALVDLVLDTT